MAENTVPSRPRLLAPLKNPIFRAFWIATVVSNIGTLMHGVGSGWLMTSLTSSAFLLGLIPTAASLPAMLLSPLGGAVADYFDRRKVLLISQSCLFLSTGTLALLTQLALIKPEGLLLLGLLSGTAAAFNITCWQALIQDLVPYDQQPAAVSLNSISFNTARSVGPALGGVIVALLGPQAVFMLNSLSFLAVIIVLARWQGSKPRRTPEAGGLWKSLRDGFHYVASKKTLFHLLLRVTLFIATSVSIIALLPLLARERFGLTAQGFGVFSSLFGIGSVSAAFATHALTQRFGVGSVIQSGFLLGGTALAVIAFSHHRILTAIALFLIGFAWVAVNVNHNIVIRISSPSTVSGRVLAYYIMTIQGGMAVGGALFGWLTAKTNLTAALCVAAAGVFVCALLAAWKGLPEPLSEAEKIQNGLGIDA